MSSDQGGSSGSGDRSPGRLSAVLVLEGIAALIALVEPLTPSKTGSKWSPAEIFATDPTYPEKVLASFVAVNILIAVLGVLVWGLSRLRRSG